MTTTMPSWVTQAAEAVTAATDVANAQRELDTLGVAKVDLGVHLGTLRMLSTAAASAGGDWTSGYTGNPELFDALKAAAKNPSQSALGNLNRALNTFAPNAKAQLLSDWHAYATQQLGNVAELAQLANTLAEVQSVAAMAGTLQQVLSQLAQIQNKLPTQAAFDLLNQAEKCLVDLEKALQPEGVRKFLSAVARGGASQEMLTDDVRAWLKENRAERSFRITAGRPADA